MHTDLGVHILVTNVFWWFNILDYGWLTVLHHGKSIILHLDYQGDIPASDLTSLIKNDQQYKRKLQ